MNRKSFIESAFKEIKKESSKMINMTCLENKSVLNLKKDIRVGTGGVVPPLPPPLKLDKISDINSCEKYSMFGGMYNQRVSSNFISNIDQQ